MTADKTYIGIDIGGTKCAVVKGNARGEILQKIRFETTTCEESVANILQAAKKMGAADAAGISCGNPLDAKRGLILSPPNLPGWDNVPIVEMVEAELGIPAFLQNDADACALAEWQFGAGRGCENMIFLTFGTGMGAGLILGGRLYSGTNGNAGEVGHIRMAPFGPVGYGKAGSFEGFCSGGGIAQFAAARAREALQMGNAVSYCTSVEELSAITVKKIAVSAAAGNRDAIELLSECGEMLGRGLSVLIDLLNPQRIVIGSIYARAGAFLEESMQRVLAAEVLPQSRAVCEILPAALGESLGDIAAVAVAVEGMKRKEEK